MDSRFRGNDDIRLADDIHGVAKLKWYQIRRPVFTQLRRGPLSEQCSFISYDTIDMLAESEFLPHMNESVIADYEVLADT